jgi:hypothetical protein
MSWNDDVYDSCTCSSPLYLTRADFMHMQLITKCIYSLFKIDYSSAFAIFLEIYFCKFQQDEPSDVGS